MRQARNNPAASRAKPLARTNHNMPLGLFLGRFSRRSWLPFLPRSEDTKVSDSGNRKKRRALTSFFTSMDDLALPLFGITLEDETGQAPALRTASREDTLSPGSLVA